MTNEPREDFKRKIIAIHEAGHGVICYKLRYKFETITITQNLQTGSDGAFKRSIIEMPAEAKNMPFHDYVIDQIKITLSGGAAVHILAITDDAELYGMLPDCIQAFGLAKMVTKSEEEAKRLNNDLAFQAKELVRDKKNWLAINCLAEELIKKGTVTYNEAKKVIENAFSAIDCAQAVN